MRHFSALVLLLIVAATSTAQDQAAEAKKIPVIDAGLGNCSVEFTVRDSAQKPVYAAKIHVRVLYGFMGLHKLDLEAATNVDGKLRFTGLSAKARQPLEFHASKDDLQGMGVVDLSKECNSEHTIVLQKAVGDSPN